MNMRMRLALGLIVGAAITSSALLFRDVRAQQLDQAATSPQADARGQTMTQLGDGRWLVLGGEGRDGVLARAAIVDVRTGAATPIESSMLLPRAFHSATLLPDGRVLIVGGRGADRHRADAPEIFDPHTRTFSPAKIEGGLSRSGHSATLLSDGRVLIAGGTAADDRPVQELEFWDVEAGSANAIGWLPRARSGQTATLLADGRVALSGGVDVRGRGMTQPVVIDPSNGVALEMAVPADGSAAATIVASMPADGAVDVPVSSRIGLRVSRPINPETVNPRTMTLIGDEGQVDAVVVAAERGRLVFVTPRERLHDGGTYHLVIDGVVDVAGEPLSASQITFVTAQPADKGADAPDAGDAEAWLPDDLSRKNGWRADRGTSPWETLPPLLAPPGVTAISGRVLTLDGRPLAGVTLAAAGIGETESDRSGRFLLLAPAATGRHVLDIDGASASRAGRRYGFFEYGLDVESGRTKVLPFTIWMPKLDTRHTVRIPSPTTSEVVITTPYIPGLELHIPPNTVIRGEDGKPVTELGITPIPVDRPPFPLAKNVVVPVYFTIQPGGGYVHTAGTGIRGAWLVYPNYRGEYPGKRAQFYHYDPELKDWYVYGLGTVTRSAAQVVPDPSTRIYELTGAMISSGDNPNPEEPDDECCNDGDPVSLATGIFTVEEVDLSVPDVIPLGVKRTYMSRDPEVRPFGFGMTHPYAMFLWSAQQYVEADLILPDGRHIHYVRTSPGEGYTDAIFTHKETPTTSATPSAFYRSVMAWNGRGWDITLKDGTVYVFGENAPLQAIRDRFGNTVTITRADGGQFGNIDQVTSPNGRWIRFTYNASNRITQAKDHIGRTVTYTYDGNGNLATVTDPESRVTSYTYDTSHRLLTVRPPHLQGTSVNFVTNEYTTAADAPTPVGWVKKQTFPDGGTYQFAYTVVNGRSTQTDVTDQRGYIRRVTLNSEGYRLTETLALGQPEQQVTTTTRQPKTHFVTSETDALGHQTARTHDAWGNVLTVTRLAGTQDAVTTTYTYDPIFSQILTVNDPLNHTTTIGYDARGNPTSVTNALNQTSTYGYNGAGQLTSLTDALQHTTLYEYAGADMVKVTDALGAVTQRTFDSVGRIRNQTDPLGRITQFEYDKLNHLTKLIDPLAGTTTYGYDLFRRLSTITDAQNHATARTYDAFGRVATVTDPLSKTDTFAYDVAGTMSVVNDRKGQSTTRTQDALNRLKQITFADSSTIVYGYDGGNRLTSIADSVNGTITRTFDDLNRLTSETTAQGAVSYTYDAADRRATMTVLGQPTVSYGYDAADRLTSATQGTSTVSITYNDVGLRSTLTLPNGIVVTHTYDDASQLTGLTYTQGAVTLGTLTYAYDLAGRRTELGGTWARTGLPRAVASASFDAANRLTNWAGTLFSYDATGNLASDGPNSYAWNARNELTAVTGEAPAGFQYDAMQRRVQKTSGGQGTGFLFDGDNVVQEQASGVPSANLLTGLSIDEIWTRTDSQGTRTLLLDALRSTMAETDQAGTPQTSYSYEPFGRTETTGAASSSLFQYTGREASAAVSDVYYYRARYYNAALGRFLSEDPAAFGGGQNLYAYVDNNPVSLVDPMGLQARPVVPGRQPDGSYRADFSDPRMKPLTEDPFPSAPKPYGESDQCVSLTKMFTGAPCANCWRAGPKVLGNTNLPPGTAIATFNANGRYPSDTETMAKNSGIYLGQRGTNVYIIDQWPGHTAQARAIDPGGRPQNDANAYSVVLVPPGTQSSKCKCL